MPDTWKKLMTQVTVVDDLSFAGEFAEHCLKRDPIGPHILQQTLPPVRPFFDDLVEFCLGYAIASARLDEHLAADTSVAQSLSRGFRQFLTFAGCALIDGDDRHGGYLPGLLVSSRTRSSLTSHVQSLPYSFRLRSRCSYRWRRIDSLPRGS